MMRGNPPTSRRCVRKVMSFPFRWRFRSQGHERPASDCRLVATLVAVQTLSHPACRACHCLRVVVQHPLCRTVYDCQGSHARDTGAGPCGIHRHHRPPACGRAGGSKALEKMLLSASTSWKVQNAGSASTRHSISTVSPLSGFLSWYAVRCKPASDIKLDW